jgi:hypothetical protein
MQHFATALLNQNAIDEKTYKKLILKINKEINCHPREAMAFTADNRSDYCEFYKSLLDNF